MKNIKLQETFIILLLILLFSYLIFREYFNRFYIIEGNENKDDVEKLESELSSAESNLKDIEKEISEKLPKIIEEIEKECEENIFDSEKKFYCKRDGKKNAETKLRAQLESANLVGDVDVNIPKIVCPDVNDFYTLFSKSKCLADKMRSNISIGSDFF
jgi:hypothetical protein